MKKLNDLKGVTKLSKNEQKSLCGGIAFCRPDGTCAAGLCCINGGCTKYCKD